ncbi:hypothetical protein ACHAPV_003219 [Trichoderma viride]
MLAKSQAIYAEALHRARALIEQTDKTALAKLLPGVLMMAMYEYKIVPGILTSTA